MLLSLRKNGLDSLFKEVRVFEEMHGIKVPFLAFSPEDALRYPQWHQEERREEHPQSGQNKSPTDVLFLGITLQPEIIAKLTPKTLFHVTEMRFFKK